MISTVILAEINFTDIIKMTVFFFYLSERNDDFNASLNTSAGTDGEQHQSGPECELPYSGHRLVYIR